MPWVLLVEEDSLKRDLLSRRLKARGFDVLAAVDGGHGIDVARRERPDLVVIDTDLPDMDGWDAVRRLREGGATQGVPVIAVGGQHPTAGWPPAPGLRALCDDCETKPIDVPRLVGKIQALLERQPARPV